MLLDTHVWIWALIAESRLGKRARQVLTDPGNELFLSPVSVWEAHLIIERGRVQVDSDPGSWLREALRRLPLRDAALTRDVALASRSLELDSADPADRFLAATALVHDLELATADRALLADAGTYRTLDATT